ncbi:MAG: hypothetical protein DWQ19_12435 [Crenarchaeota archaeon]|nr:MAG: hypothetical protein DWQ19_12435 [Thermoproteota archaeon]
MKSKKSLILSLTAVFLTICVIFSATRQREFKIEDYAFVPPELQQEYEAIKTTIPEGENLTKFTPLYTSDSPPDENLPDVQCPIPMEDRVPNRTGIQCVWSSIEMLGRWAEEPKLMDPPLTSRPQCKSFSSPSLSAKVLKELNVKFEQTYGDRQAGIALIKKAMKEGRGCLWDVPGHAMVLIHYDEEADVVKWVDNSDSRLAVQTTTIDKFKRRWGSWILVIYADNDIIPAKLNRNFLAPKLPIRDQNNPQGEYPKDYIPIPRKDEVFEIPSLFNE